MSINNISIGDVAKFKYIQTTPGEARENTIDGYQRIATQNANYPGKGTALGLIYIAGKLAGEAGELVQQPFKAMRDDGLLHVEENDPDIQFLAVGYQPLTSTRHNTIIKEAGGVLWYLAALANELNISLSDIAFANLEQLAGRTERGTLQGDGDER